MTFSIDLDGTLTNSPGIRYTEYYSAEPNYELIAKVNKLYDEGHRIIIFTARHTSDRIVSTKWLEDHKVKYHELILGKPLADYYIDDRNVSIEQFMEGDY